VATLELEMRAAMERCEALSAEEAAIGARLPALKAEAAALENGVAEMSGAKQQQLEVLDRVSSELREKEARLSELGEELAKVNEAKQVAEDEAREVERLQARREELEGALALAAREAEEAKGRVDEAQAEQERLEGELEGLREAVSGLLAEEEKLCGVREEMAQLAEARQAAEEEVKAIEQLAERRAELETGLTDLMREVESATDRATAVRTEKGHLEAELTGLRERVEGMRVEERALDAQVGVQRNDLHAAGAALETLRQKLSQMEGQVSEFTRSGGELVSVGEALMAMKARKEDTQKSMKEAAEKELELQVRLGALQEAINRETARAEQAVRDRAEVEEEFRVFAEKVQEQAQQLRAERAALARAVEELKAQRAGFAEAETQMKQWGQIEARLRGQLEELEEKHEVMRGGLKVDEGTVLMFAIDLIKRLDLIDSLRQRYAGGDVAEQLYTLRASVEDVLLQHGVVEFDVEPGTVVDVELRRRITVVDTVPGKDRPQVLETFRSGFLRVMDDGQERILRKLEVRTSSPG